MFHETIAIKRYYHPLRCHELEANFKKATVELSPLNTGNDAIIQSTTKSPTEDSSSIPKIFGITEHWRKPRMSCAIRGQYTGKEPSRTPILILNEQGIDNTRSGELSLKGVLYYTSSVNKSFLMTRRTSYT